MYTPFYQGLFLAPHVVAQSTKTAVLIAAVFEKLGFDTLPAKDAPRNDIVQSVRFDTAQQLIAFCRGVQLGAPVDSYATPEPCEMPGYEDPVIMAAGSFIQGAFDRMERRRPDPCAVHSLHPGRPDVRAPERSLF